MDIGVKAAGFVSQQVGGLMTKASGQALRDAQALAPTAETFAGTVFAKQLHNPEAFEPTRDKLDGIAALLQRANGGTAGSQHLTDAVHRVQGASAALSTWRMQGGVEAVEGVKQGVYDAIKDARRLVAQHDAIGS